ncbi:MAG: 5'/3'-nucleotidase SurE [Halodesulfurarchaeum sp.]
MDDRPVSDASQSSDVEVLLTNDDGIGSPGLRALYDALSEVGEVTAVAPVADQSAVGRSLSSEATVHGHELGYAVEGTPSDCVVAGLDALPCDPDVVVSGCNEGANLGMYVLGRSGTVSAAVEAAFFGVPAIAVSLYVPGDDITFAEVETDTGDYAEAARAIRYLVEHALGVGVFDRADYLNVNAPAPSNGRAPLAVTRPSHAHEMTATYEDGKITLHDEVWAKMADGDVDDPPGTDRRAVVEGRVSVSPLTAPHSVEHHEALGALAERYESA